MASTEDRPDADRLDGPSRGVPRGLRSAGMWCLWGLVIGTFGYFALKLAVLLGTVVLTFLAGLLLTSLMRPLVSALDRAGLPRLLAAWLVLLGFLAGLGGVGWFLQMRISGQLSELGPTLSQGLQRVQDFLVGTVGLSAGQVDSVVDGLTAQFGLGSNGGAAGSSGDGTFGGVSGGGAIVSGVTTAVTVLASIVLALFTAFWLAYDGDRVWAKTLLAVPTARRETVDAAVRSGWHALGGFLRGTTLVALGDAIGVAVALVLIGVPLPFALALLTFLGAYVPIIGAFVAGLAAVVVAFAAGGVLDAALTLGAVILVQQIEGNLLQPLIMRRTVSLHPLVIVYVLTVGGLLYGLAGAVVAVPVAAVVYAVALTLAARQGGPPEAERRGSIPARHAAPPGTAPPGTAPPANGATEVGEAETAGRTEPTTRRT